MKPSSPATSPDELLKQIYALLGDGKLQSAQELCDESLRRFPNDPRLMVGLAKTLLMQGRKSRAIRNLRRVTGDFPAYSPGWQQLGIALAGEERHQEAVQAFEQARIAAPEPLDDAALDSLRQAVSRCAESAEHWRVLGEACARRGDAEEAAIAFEQGLRLAPDDGPLLLLLGHQLRILGQLDGAIAAYEKCATLYPDVGEVYYSLANLKTYRFSEPMLDLMARKLAGSTGGGATIVNLHFALGKALEDRREYAAAFDHFRLGNKLHRSQHPYDADRVSAYFDRIQGVFTAERLRDAPAKDDEIVPIFVVGLPRSGSTLVQQILASHDAVEAADELIVLERLLHDPASYNGRRLAYPDAFEEISTAEARELGRRYLDNTRVYCRGKPFFVDKMPINFVFAGAIRLMLPQARIVNVRRNPVASCVSCYKQLFYEGHRYANDLGDLGRYFVDYDRLIKHWHSVMPDQIYDIEYEDLVAGQEAATRSLLDFCGLPFSEQCLRFHESGHAVATASSEQVRQPIYTSALESWRNYEPFIGELIEELEPVLAA